MLPSPSPALRVLVVDDEKNILTTLSMCLEGMGCSVATATTEQTALQALGRQPFDMAFLDLRLKDQSGLELLPKLLHESPNLAVVVITAYANFDTAVQAIKRGAMDYLPKPFTPDQIRHEVEQAAERLALRRRLVELERKLAESAPESDLSSGSPKMRATLDIITRAAAPDAAVLLRGESGTGKGVLARALPEGGHRAWALNVLELAGDRIARTTFFLDAEKLFPRFGLPLDLRS